jgi:predicted dehydrogenase
VAVATRNEQGRKPLVLTADLFAKIADDGIDLITISVNVPAHCELVLAALSAGKAVYCEAPLGQTVAENTDIAGAVRSYHTAIGLQARLKPAVRRAAQLVSSGNVAPKRKNSHRCPPGSGRSCLPPMTI